MIKLFSQQKSFKVIEIGIMKLSRLVAKDILEAGEVGYVIANFKVNDLRVGDTLTTVKNAVLKPLPGYQIIKPVVFCGFFPADSSQYFLLKESLKKLKLNDYSLMYEPENSKALGFGFRIGFLGLLHLEITKERLTREFKLELIVTVPSVVYHVFLKNKTNVKLENPSDMPELSLIDHIKEPFVKAEIITPERFIGKIMEISHQKRAHFLNMDYFNEQQVSMKFFFPLAEIIYDFFDQLKSVSQGYATFSYEIAHYQQNDLKKLDIFINGEIIDALSIILHKDKVYSKARQIVDKLKDLIPKQLFEVPIQAGINKKIIARNTIKAMRKDVTAKLYGGDITRRKKLLEKQKKGKKKMKTLGKIKLPQKLFLAFLSEK